MFIDSFLNLRTVKPGKQNTFLDQEMWMHVVCRGMGRCGTCAVKINGLPPELINRERNEEQTLLKMGIREGNVRLSCQLLVDRTLANISVEIIPVS